jgi:riboflavin kinase/FMN adenylyltransferase
MPTTALTIGNFDGVHLGHRALIARARALAPRVVALAFDPHPAAILRPDAAPPRLTTFEQRRSALLDAGAHDVVRLAPTPDLLHRSPHDFVAQLVQDHAPSFIVEGVDFRFGKGRSGDIATLRTLARSFTFSVEVVPPVEVALSDHQIAPASSSLIRWLLSHGRVADAALVLGRNYQMTGTVIRGDQRGRTINCPTANLKSECMPPADGVYAAWGILADGQRFPAALSIGTRPTFDGLDRRVEAHLLDFDPTILPGEYGWSLTIEIVAWVREQVRYHSIDALCDQIARDCERVRDLLALPQLASTTRVSTCV